jgi:hypothetical protein
MRLSVADMFIEGEVSVRGCLLQGDVTGRLEKRVTETKVLRDRWPELRKK